MLESCRWEICESIDQVLDLISYPVRDKKNKRLKSFSEIIENSKENISDNEMFRIIWRLARIPLFITFRKYYKIVGQ